MPAPQVKPQAAPPPPAPLPPKAPLPPPPTTRRLAELPPLKGPASAATPAPLPTQTPSAPPPSVPPSSATTAEQPPAQAKPPTPAPVEQAYAEFTKDPNFSGHAPTREQVARAWSFARFQKEHVNDLPNHAEVVAALKKMFPEFRSGKTISVRSR
jgi:hypothetical protein